MRAYHRWLGSLCEASPGRRVGIGVLGPVYDVDETLQQLDFMRNVGLRGVTVPPPADFVPPLIDRFYDPVWARCSELRMPLHVHAGWGGFPDPRIARNADPKALGLAWSVQAITATEAGLMGRRALWILMLGGVLERHPI